MVVVFARQGGAGSDFFRRRGRGQGNLRREGSWLKRHGGNVSVQKEVVGGRGVAYWGARPGRGTTGIEGRRTGHESARVERMSGG